MQELTVRVDQQVGTIHFNYEEIRDMLAQQMEAYKDVQFSEETKAQAKSEIATLRKIKKAIDDKRKEVKNQCLVPYKEFEAKATELMGLIDEPIGLIDRQIKEFDEKQKAEKKAKIEDVYWELIGEMGEYLPFERIYDPRWENTTRSMKSIKEEIGSLVTSARTAVETISGMTSDAVPEALERYKQTLDMAGAIAYINQYEQQKAEILKREEEHRRREEERRRQEEIERAKAEERRKLAEIEQAREEERKKAEAEASLKAEPVETETPFPQAEIPAEEEDVDDLPFVTPSTLTVFYKVVAAPEELRRVEMAFNSLGVSYERRDA